MAHQITLTDEDYAALAAAAKILGTSVNELLHQAIAERFPQGESASQIVSYRAPTGKPISALEETEMERLAQEIGSEKPWASEMVIEDRGPR